MTYASPRGILRARAMDNPTRKRRLRGVVKHRDDRDAYDYSKAPKKKSLGLFARLQRLFGL